MTRKTVARRTETVAGIAGTSSGIAQGAGIAGTVAGALTVAGIAETVVIAAPGAGTSPSNPSNPSPSLLRREFASARPRTMRPPPRE